MSPLSDTTNLAPAMAGGELFSHILYMTITTVPTILVTLVIFIIIGFTQDTTAVAQTEPLLLAIKERFNISPLLFAVPVVVVVLIARKTPPLVALLIGTLLGAIFALLFQQPLLADLAGVAALDMAAGYKVIMDTITVSTAIETSNPMLNDLFQSGGMSGMLGTIWLIICAMVFGGIMDAIGALKAISAALLSWAESTFQLFASTVVSCLAINVTASDQYLSLVVPGKMFQQAYKDRGLAPENLSRTLEDSGTVTSVLVPWNTCGAYQSGVLGVSVADYFIYAIFNWLSPFTTLLVAAIRHKIKELNS
jgi:NhaC family Na+:H+ antiporter